VEQQPSHEWIQSRRHADTIVFEEATEHAKKVEFLVHRHLHKYRRREILISGACNGGKGCRHVHKEWFDVSSDLASFVVNAWVRWMSNVPYDEIGYLKPIWIEQVNSLTGIGVRIYGMSGLIPQFLKIREGL
jgi:hypothetical protein